MNHRYDDDGDFDFEAARGLLVRFAELQRYPVIRTKQSAKWMRGEFYVIQHILQAMLSRSVTAEEVRACQNSLN